MASRITAAIRPATTATRTIAKTARMKLANRERFRGGRAAGATGRRGGGEVRRGRAARAGDVGVRGSRGATRVAAVLRWSTSRVVASEAGAIPARPARKAAP